MLFALKFDLLNAISQFTGKGLFIYIVTIGYVVDNIYVHMQLLLSAIIALLAAPTSELSPVVGQY